jgi:hypothetical protein
MGALEYQRGVMFASVIKCGIRSIVRISTENGDRRYSMDITHAQVRELRGVLRRILKDLDRQPQTAPAWSSLIFDEGGGQ